LADDINDIPLSKRAAECRARAKEALFASGKAASKAEKEELRIAAENWLLLAAKIDVMTGT
jgi:hypothetical protein